jgi:hypothetical protein
MEAHPEQPLDFYGALRARMYDEGILKWMQHDVRHRPRSTRPAHPLRLYRLRQSFPWGRFLTTSSGSRRRQVGEERTQAVIRDLARPFRYLAPLVIGVEVPAFTGEGLDMSITRLLLCAGELEQEQQHVKDHQLAQEYMRWQELPEVSCPPIRHSRLSSVVGGAVVAVNDGPRVHELSCRLGRHVTDTRGGGVCG